MASTITRLTPEQEQRLVTFREEQRAIGTRTGHDDECAEVGRTSILDAYREIGIEPPEFVLWAQSPLQALLMHLALKGLLERQNGEKRPRGDLNSSGSLRDQLRDQLRGQLGGQLVGQLEGQLWGQLWGQLVGQLVDQLGDQLWDQLVGQLEGQLWGQLVGQPGDQLKHAWNQRWCWGQCESYWLAWARFGISIGVVVTDEQERRLQIMERMARATFMAFSWRGCAILVQHPSVAKFDVRHRLNCTDGPALAWPDGYAVYAVSGIRLTPERGVAMAAGTLTARQILEEPNAEVRRVLVNTYNAGDSGRWVSDLGAEPIHEDVDALGLPRRLYQIEQPGDEPYTLIEVTNSTPEPDGTRKLYRFRCDPLLRPFRRDGDRVVYGSPQAMTCQNAIASTYGFTGDQFQLVVQT